MSTKIKSALRGDSYYLVVERYKPTMMRLTVVDGTYILGDAYVDTDELLAAIGAETGVQ